MSELAVGQDVWYLRRFQPPRPGVIASIDRSVQPPSYGVRLGDFTRETEQDRLAPRLPGEKGPALPPDWHQGGAPAEDEFGGFEAADEFGEFAAPQLAAQPAGHSSSPAHEDKFGDFTACAGGDGVDPGRASGGFDRHVLPTLAAVQ